MEPSAMLKLIKSELDRKVGDEEAEYFGCQCAADFSRPLLTRVEAILRGEDPRDYKKIRGSGSTIFKP
jgi:hypothetical protein